MMKHRFFRFSSSFASFHILSYVNDASLLEYAHGLQDPRKGNERGTFLNYNASSQNHQNDSDWGFAELDETLELARPKIVMKSCVWLALDNSASLR